MSREIMQQALDALENAKIVMGNLTSDNCSDCMYIPVTKSIAALKAELAKPEQKGISSGLCLHPSALNYLDKKKVRTRLDYQPYTGVGEALEKELGESNE